MTSIPSFGESLLKNPPVTNTQTASVEEILQNTPAPVPAQEPDTFQRENAPVEQPKKGFDWFRAGAFALGALGIFLAGRKGIFGKRIQTWFGGRMSLKKVHKNIQQKLTEYLGRDGVSVNKTEITKGADGKQILKAEFADGTTREFALTENKNIIRLASNPATAGS